MESASIMFAPNLAKRFSPFSKLQQTNMAGTTGIQPSKEGAKVDKYYLQCLIHFPNIHPFFQRVASTANFDCSDNRTTETVTG